MLIMRTHHSFQKQEQGFTLVEILVAVFIFTLVSGAAIGLLVSAVNAQRRSLAEQDVIDEASFVIEYMSRALREAKKDLGPTPTCLTTPAVRGWNYQTEPGFPPPIQRVRFIDKDDICREFSMDPLSETQIMEKISTDNTAANFGTAQPLTSDNLEVLRFGVFLRGAFQGDSADPNYIQPRVALTIEIQSKNTPNIPPLRLQTTVTQRALDIQL